MKSINNSSSNGLWTSLANITKSDKKGAAIVIIGIISVGCVGLCVEAVKAIGELCK
jgi:hypothetical protein